MSTNWEHWNYYGKYPAQELKKHLNKVQAIDFKVIKASENYISVIIKL